MEPTAKARILIVEDENSAKKALSEKYIAENFEVMTASDGANGLQMSKEKHPDIILLDLIMPVIDGVTMLERLRKNDEWGKRVPVIIFTNVASENETFEKEISDLGPESYLIKADWKIADVVAKVKETLAKVKP